MTQPTECRRGTCSRAARAIAIVLWIASGLASRPLRAQDLAGTWQGTMQAAKPQRIVVKIAKDPAAGWQAVVYGLDSNMTFEGRATTQMSLQGAELRFAIAPIDTSYQGKLSADGATIAGTWTQADAAHPLTLARVTGDAAWDIPRAGALMAKDADPDWDVLTVKARDPDDPSTSSSITIKGRQFALANQTVEAMLQFGYGLQRVQIAGAPHWTETERWDVQGVPDVPGHPSIEQMQSLTRKVLAQRFGLKLHHETKELSVYAITVAKGGEKMAGSAGDPNGTSDERDGRSGPLATLTMTNVSMSSLAAHLGNYLDRPTVDQTHLTGRYDFQLKWTADESKLPTDVNAAPGLFTAIQEQIGLKLEPVKAPAEVLVIDAVEKPTAN